MQKLLLTAVLLSGVGLTAPLASGADYALLVAVGDYDRKELRPLRFTRNDIQEFATMLVASGYKAENIVLMHDDLAQLKDRRYLPEARKIREELDLVLEGLDQRDTLIVALAGHGVQFRGEKQNYFCPVDARLSDRDTLISLNYLYAQMRQCRAGHKLLLVDACRNDPQSDLARSRQTVDLESITRPQTEPVPEGIVALFSCSQAQQSFEDPKLEHGLFFHSVLEGWKGAADGNGDGKLTLDELTGFAKEKTQAYARLEFKALQVPQQKGEFSGVWVLRALSSRPVNTPATPLRKSFSNSIGLQFTLIPSGSFRMGSPTNEGNANEHPEHLVEISRPFYLSATEVTQQQFSQVIGSSPSWFSPTGSGASKLQGTDTARHPVEIVSYEDVMEFCRRLGEREQLPAASYRLPTEAEWEYAARAGTTARFGPAGDSEGSLGDIAWFKDNSQRQTHEVGRKPANAFGLYDMAGNVAEWCSDWFDENYYQQNQSRDPAGPKAPAGEALRTVRGGHWLSGATLCRPADRNAAAPQDRLNTVGFRVVRSVSATPDAR